MKKIREVKGHKWASISMKKYIHIQYKYKNQTIKQKCRNERNKEDFTKFFL